MIGESPEEILAFFTTDAFAREVAWTPQVGAPATVLGIFDEGDEAKDFSSQRSEVMVASPTLRCPYFQVKNVRRQDRMGFTDPTGSARTFFVMQNPEREADGLTAIIHLREDR